jgi:serine/threonine-protein kinase
VLLAVTRGAVIASRYEVRSPIGRGGMGEVYRAYDRVLEEEVALKVLRAEDAGAEDWARRFRSEIRLARR